MERKNNHREHGFALVSTLALLVVLSLLIASAVALTQFLTAEVDTLAISIGHFIHLKVQSTGQ